MVDGLFPGAIANALLSIFIYLVFIMRCLLLFLLFILSGTGFSEAQTADPDTVDNLPVLLDTTHQHKNAGIDSLVNYSAQDSIIYSLRTRYMSLYGKSEMQYQTIHLKSERVSVNWDDATLIAYGAVDTSKPDSIIGKPIMRDGGDEYHGDQVRYNFRSRKGKITVGNTQMDDGYYVGANIKKIEPNVLCVSDGTYTTCDAKEPHFHFESPKMKVFVRDKVVAEPVYFFVAGVPVFVLPFGVFPAHGGRSSGIITPAYGEDERFGWYLSHIGYYWAVSDYWDIATMFDIYSRGRWQNQTNLRYALRYNFGGSITARITNTPEGEAGDPNYSMSRQYYVNVAHGQQISPTSHLDVNFTFMSSDYFRKYSLNLNNVLQQNIISTATYWKNWEKANQSLSISVFRDQNLMTDETNEQVPSIAFSQGTIFPFRKSIKTRGIRSVSESESEFIETLGLSYSINAKNNQSKVKDIDTIQNKEIVNNFKRTRAQSVNQHASLSLSPKVGYFTISPSLVFNDTRSWTDIEEPFRGTDSLLSTRTNKSKITSGYVSAGVNASTRFYGLFQPGIFGISAVRHTVTPSFGLVYSKQVYGENMQKYAMTGSFSVGNNFEMKLQKSDSAKTEEKIQLLNIGVSTQYNFAADSMNFSPVGISFRTDIGQYLGISGNATYNLYKYDPAAFNGTGARVNRFLLQEEGRLGDLTSFSLSVSTSFRGEKKAKKSEAAIPENIQDEQASVSGQTAPSPASKKLFYSMYDREDADFSIPWNVSVSFNFSHSRPTPKTYYRSSSMNASLSFNLTEKWQISTNGTYDFVRKEHFIQSVSVTRDLHCWQMSLSWQPMGMLEGYRFELRVKAPQLQDMKISKQRNVQGNY